MGIQINGSTDTISAVDGSLSLVGGELRTVSGLNVSGVATATTFIGDLQVSTGSTVSGSTNVITASTNGSERVRITSSGNVGIGTDTPYSNASFNTLSVGGSGKYGLIELVKSNGVAGSWIDSHGTAGDGNLRFTTAGTSGAITFWTGGEFTEKARIDSSGNVGIGTTLPAGVNGKALTVYASDYPRLRLINDATGTASGDGAALFMNSDDLYVSNEESGGQILFRTAAQERARIDSSGRLLVGTSTARTNAPGGTEGFLVEGTSSTNSQNRFIQQVFGSSTTDGPYLGLAKTRSTSIGGNTIVQSGDELGGIYFQGADGSNLKQGASILSYVDGTPGINDMPGRLVFSTTADGASSPTERLRIDSQGFVGIGGVSPTRKLHVHESAAGTNSYLSLTNNTTGSTGSDGFQIICLGADGGAVLMQRESASMTFYTNGTQKAEITSAGRFYLSSTWYSTFTTANAANVHAVSNGEFYRSTSSQKYKTDVETIQDSYSDAILNIRPVWYRSLAEADNSDHSWWGFIAEEVAEVDPRLVQWKTVDVSYDENGSPVETPCDPEPEGVAYDRFVPHLLNLIKRQKEQIDAMEARLAALEAN